MGPSAKIRRSKNKRSKAVSKKTPNVIAKDVRKTRAVTISELEERLRKAEADIVRLNVLSTKYNTVVLLIDNMNEQISKIAAKLTILKAKGIS